MPTRDKKTICHTHATTAIDNEEEETRSRTSYTDGDIGGDHVISYVISSQAASHSMSRHVSTDVVDSQLSADVIEDRDL